MVEFTHLLLNVDLRLKTEPARSSALMAHLIALGRRLVGACFPLLAFVDVGFDIGSRSASAGE